MADSIPTPDLGAIIPTVEGRKIAYAVFGIVSLLVGNSVVFAATAFGEVPIWLLAISAVVVNMAPLFGGLAIANAKTTESDPVSLSKATEIQTAATTQTAGSGLL